VHRFFTVDEANALVPLLVRKIERLQAIRAAAGPLRESLRRLEEKARGNGQGRADELRDLQERLRHLATEADGLLEEIVGLGCEVKDVEQGLVDFPSERAGRVVYLCWKLGEDRIRFWHELDTGFAGRQPLQD
jgi:hypothetical protein